MRAPVGQDARTFLSDSAEGFVPHARGDPLRRGQIVGKRCRRLFAALVALMLATLLERVHAQLKLTSTYPSLLARADISNRT
jgi:hypothetical protein